MQLHLTLTLPVSLNQLYINEYKYNPKTKKSEPTGKRILSDKGTMNKKTIQKETKRQIKGQDWEISNTLNKYFYMDVIIYFNRTNRDADNIFKILNDSLEGIVFKNDSRILPRVQRILYDATNPKIEVFFTPCNYIGIFDSLIDLEEFEENCHSCRFYLNSKCSVLVKAKEGRIQDEIENTICSKYTEKKS